METYDPVIVTCPHCLAERLFKVHRADKPATLILTRSCLNCRKEFTVELEQRERGYAHEN